MSRWPFPEDQGSDVAGFLAVKQKRDVGTGRLAGSFCLRTARREWRGSARRRHMGLGTILIIILIIALLGGFSGLGGGPFYGTGYYGGGGLGLVLIIIIILVVLGRI
jgi:hypothetical protein